MSRVGKQPIPIPDGVKVQVQPDRVLIEAKGGKIMTPLPNGIQCEHKDGVLIVGRANDSRNQRAFHGMVRAHLANAVRGVSKGFQRELDIVGIGYRAQVKGRHLVFNIGFSHQIDFPLPEGIEAKVEKNTHLILTGPDKQKIGQAAAEIRSLRPPEPYKGKGIRYTNEQVRRKAGKAGKAGATA